MIYLFENPDGNASIVYDETILSEGDKLKGVAVESLPEKEVVPGKVAVLKVRKSTREVWYEYVDAPIDRDEEIEKLRNDLNEAVMELSMLIAMGGTLDV